MEKLVFDGGFGTECTRQGFIQDVSITFSYLSGPFQKP